MMPANAFVKLSPRDGRYLELDDGSPYVPIGLNLVAPPEPEAFVATLDTLARNRMNYCRLWLNHGCFHFEPTRSGVFDAGAAANLDRFLALARERGIRVKLCLEYFRAIPAVKTCWSDNPVHHQAGGGPFADMDDFLRSEAGIRQFKDKLAWYQERVGDDPTVYAWELWNEMNCVGPIALWAPWTRTMLAELHRLFPRNLAVQSLGSFDQRDFRCMYAVLATLADNDIAQVHRYLDLGAPREICHGPVDVLAAEAVRELQALGSDKPIILAESGAVEPRHSGPFKYYAADKAGTLLHDVLWAPFMSGAAGPGQIWHWNRYVQPNDLWWQFDRFAEAIEGIDPPAEAFEPLMLEHPRLRVYALRGKRVSLVWCRDQRNDWQAELARGEAPERLSNLTLDLSAVWPHTACGKIRAFDPWSGTWTSPDLRGKSLDLPAFSRSLALRLEANWEHSPRHP